MYLSALVTLAILAAAYFAGKLAADQDKHATVWFWATLIFPFLIIFLIRPSQWGWTPPEDYAGSYETREVDEAIAITRLCSHCDSPNYPLDPAWPSFRCGECEQWTEMKKAKQP